MVFFEVKLTIFSKQERLDLVLNKSKGLIGAFDPCNFQLKSTEVSYKMLRRSKKLDKLN